MTGYRVSKIIVRIGNSYLMSLKRKQGADDARLEFLGGRHEKHESALDALVRELREEETTGYLAEYAETLAGPPVEIQVGEGHHFVFLMELTSECAGLLRHDPQESHGFQLVPSELLRPGQLFTRKTNGILKSLNLAD